MSFTHSLYLLLMRHWITDVVVVFVQLWTRRWCRYILLWFWWWTHNDTFSICTWLLLWYLSDFKHLHNFTHAPCTSVHTDSWWFWHLCQRNAHSYYNETAVKCVNDCLWPWEYKPFVSHTQQIPTILLRSDELHNELYAVVVIQHWILSWISDDASLWFWWIFIFSHLFSESAIYYFFFLLYFCYVLLYSSLCCFLKAKAFTAPSNIHDIY